MRSQSFLNKPLPAQELNFQDMQGKSFLIVASPGPTSFVVLEQQNVSDNDEPLQLKFKVFLGNPHICSCMQGRKSNYCIHICFILTKRFKIEHSNPLWHQTCFTDAELQNLLKGEQSQYTTRVQNRSFSVNPIQTNMQPVKHQNEITEDMFCPICIEIFDQSNASQLPFCSNCGNSLHQNCLFLYQQHAKSDKKSCRCPYCREEWRNGHTLVSEETPILGRTKSLPSKIKVNQCNCCLKDVSKNNYILQKYSNKKYCFCCVLDLERAFFNVNGRQIILRRQVSGPPIQTERTRLLGLLQQRDILTDRDYQLLLQLDNPHIDQRFVTLKFPGYLLPKCLKQSNLEKQRCILCNQIEPYLYNLLNDPESSSATPSSVLCDYCKLSDYQRIENENYYTVDQLKQIVCQNSQYFMPCASHVAHEICLLLTGVSKPVLYVNNDYFMTKICPDFCSACNIPLLKEWLRESKLQEKPEILKPQQLAQPNMLQNSQQTDPFSGLTIVGTSIKQLGISRQNQGRPPPIKKISQLGGVDFSGCMSVLPNIYK